MALKVAIVGATGNVGREMLDILVERDFSTAAGVVEICRTVEAGLPEAGALDDDPNITYIIR